MQDYDLDAMNARIQEDSSLIRQILDEAGKIIVGQRNLLERLIIGLLCNGHILLEGVPRPRKNHCHCFTRENH